MKVKDKIKTAIGEEILIEEDGGEVLIITYDGFGRTMALLSSSEALDLGNLLIKLVKKSEEERQ